MRAPQFLPSIFLILRNLRSIYFLRIPRLRSLPLINDRVSGSFSNSCIVAVRFNYNNLNSYIVHQSSAQVCQKSSKKTHIDFLISPFLSFYTSYPHLSSSRYQQRRLKLCLSFILIQQLSLQINFINFLMFNFLASCGLCSNRPKKGDYSYEVYNQIPTIGEITGNLNQILSSPEATREIIAKNHHSPNEFPTKFDNHTENIALVRNMFRNNCPLNSVIAGQFTFRDLVNNHPTRSPIKQILKSKYNQLIQQFQQKGGSFTDTDFPPDSSSLGSVEDLQLRANWMRIPQVFKNAIFINQSILPQNILQGTTNRYLLSAFSALAQNDFRIKNIFPNSNRVLNKYGIYMARIKFQGILREVIVDDYIPFDQHGDPLFSQPTKDKEIWTIILQKCWAKLYGSYGKIVGGLPGPVLQAFSGAPTFFYEVSKQKQKLQNLWKKMLDSYQNRSVICCGTKQNAEVQKYGLSRGQVYTILHLYQKQHRILKIRNPQINKQWRGRACASDTQFWNSISKDDQISMGLYQKNGKFFFMLWEQFVNLFDMVDICKINDNASCSSIQVQFHKKNGQILQFETRGGNTTFTLSLQSIKNKKKGAAQKYSRSIIIIAKQQINQRGVQYTYIGSSSNNLFADHHIQLNNLQKGFYVVYAKVDWISSTIDSATASIYSSYATHLKKGKQSNHQGFLYKVFLDHAYRYSNKKVINENNDSWISSNILLNQCGYGYLVFHLGKDSNTTLSFQINENQYTDQRFKLKKPYRGRGLIKAILQAGKQLIILFRIKSQQYPKSIKMPLPKVQIYKQQNI